MRAIAAIKTERRGSRSARRQANQRHRLHSPVPRPWFAKIQSFPAVFAASAHEPRRKQRHGACDARVPLHAPKGNRALGAAHPRKQSSAGWPSPSGAKALKTRTAVMHRLAVCGSPASHRNHGRSAAGRLLGVFLISRRSKPAFAVPAGLLLWLLAVRDARAERKAGEARSPALSGWE